MKSRWLIPTILLLIALAQVVLAADNRTNAPASALYGWNETLQKWIPLQCDASGTLLTGNGATMSVTLPDPVVVQDKIGRVESSNWKSVDVATNSVTLLSSIASITPPCEIEFSVNTNDMWLGPATTTVDSAKIIKMVEGHQRSMKISTGTWDAGVVADTAVASFGFVVHTLAQ